MNIYKLNYKDLKKEMFSFLKTVYGKITFALSYSVPTVLTIILLTMTLSVPNDPHIYFLSFLYMMEGLLLTLILISFILGTMYYYHELKEYIKEKK